MKALEHDVIVQPLSVDDGGGYLASVPDLPGCMSNGETPEEALANVRDAIEAWKVCAREMGNEVPKPSRQPATVE